MKTVAIVQARMGSTRLPNKVMKEICGVPMIQLLLARLEKSAEIDQIVVATSLDERNDPLAALIEGLGLVCFRGSDTDVLGRYLAASELANADVVVRITGDCPLIDAALVDEIVRRFRSSELDYYANTSPPTYPDGLDTEVFTMASLQKAASEAREPFQREHVTPYMRISGLFKVGTHTNDEDYSKLRWTVDEPADFDVVSSVFAHFSPNIYFSWHDVLMLQRHQPQIFAANTKIDRNEGSTLSNGQKLWKRAKSVIPGGNMLLSKRAEMFLPNQWPAYFSKAKGCQVWDLDGVRYTDMSIMGVGTNILGYAHPDVDAAVSGAVEAGNMSTLNCPEEVYLAERLVELHPWADMVRLARSGGEANAIAVRIARAASGRDKVAVCGYHGWHDWYLSANLKGDASLAEHLLPGLDPNGVPDNLRDTVFPFSYNNYEELRALVDKHEIGVIKMEVVRNKEPENGFLERVRELASDKNIVLIFDECTSGFRQTLGGLHKLYGVEPDMAIFGKALGNGYAITSIIGRREIMEAAQSSFISSTFWTERIGPVAALKTLEVMERSKSWETITATGSLIAERWKNLAEKHGLEIESWGLPALSGFSFKSDKGLAYKTYITQEMLQQGYLAGNSVYVTTEHSPEIVDGYFDKLEPVFAQISECEAGRDIMELLNGPICHDGFKRLN